MALLSGLKKQEKRKKEKEITTEKIKEKEERKKTSKHPCNSWTALMKSNHYPIMVLEFHSKFFSLNFKEGRKEKGKQNK